LLTPVFCSSIKGLSAKFKISRKPGVRAFQAAYAGTTISGC
jgi:hypothetical protein